MPQPESNELSQFFGFSVHDFWKFFGSVLFMDPRPTIVFGFPNLIVFRWGLLDFP
jgi:hypothetical protein